MGTSQEPTVKPNLGRRDGSSKRNLSPRPRTEISWAEINNQLVRDAIVAVTDQGAAILLGTTTDKGALSITVLNGNDRVREWPHTVEDAEATLRWLVSMFASD